MYYEFPAAYQEIMNSAKDQLKAELELKNNTLKELEEIDN
jgi:hypothetical protein